MHFEDTLINVALLAFFGICFYTFTCGAYFLYYHDDRAVPARVWIKIPRAIKAIGFLGSGVFAVCVLIGLTVAMNQGAPGRRTPAERSESRRDRIDVADRRPVEIDVN